MGVYFLESALEYHSFWRFSKLFRNWFK